MDVELKPLPPEQAIDYLRSKGFRFSWDWRDMWQEDHVKAFTVAKAMKQDLLADIRGEVDRALSEGLTLDDFQKELTPTLKRKGWWGKKIVGEGDEAQIVQLGSPFRLATIFATNIQVAYQAGHYLRMIDPDVVEEKPLWRYVAVLDDRTRPEHAAWNGIVLPHDDPFWDTHYPPNGWNCRCTVVALSQEETKRDGLRVSKSPRIETYEWKNKRTGEVVEVPVGIDPGWAYNPGKAYMRTA